MLEYDTDGADIVRFLLFLGLGITLPGMLLWRWLRGNVDGFAADAVFGTVLGCAISLLFYLPVRAVGYPRLGLAFPVLTVVAFLAVPRLRAHWRSQGPPMPAWWSAGVAGACAVEVAMTIRFGLMFEPLHFPDAARQYFDLPYHLALAADLKHHMPAQIPYVADEPLHYHWYVHAFLADASWQSGIELDVLLRRMLPMMVTVLTVLAIAVLATKLARLAWAGLAGGWLVALAANLDVYGWNGPTAIGSQQFSGGVPMNSPTHAFGVLLAAPAVWLVASLLRNGNGDRRLGRWWIGRPGGRLGSWLLLAVLLIALGGTKPTHVPIFAAAGALVVAVQLLFRKIDPSALLIALGAAGVAAGSHVLLYGPDTAGTGIVPLGTFRVVAARIGFGSDNDTTLSLVSSFLTQSVSWLAIGLGMIGFARARVWRDPSAVFLVGIPFAALGAASLLRQHGSSEVYFVRGAFPLAAAGSAWGLALLLRDAGRARVLVPAGLAAVGAGLAIAWVIDRQSQQRASGTDIDVALATTWPWLAVLLAAAMLALLIRASPLRRAGAGLAVLLVFGTMISWVPPVAADSIRNPRCVSGPERPECIHPRRLMPPGAEHATRWLRAHSSPDDLIATNSHCAYEGQGRRCDPRNFWISAYSERRVLVHGWAYTSTANRRGKNALEAFYGPFWDKQLLAANDVVFTAPTAQNIAVLRDRYRVGWLIFDTTLGPVPAALERLLPKRFEAGSVVVFQIPR